MKNKLFIIQISVVVLVLSVIIFKQMMRTEELPQQEIKSPDQPIPETSSNQALPVPPPDDSWEQDVAKEFENQYTIITVPRKDGTVLKFYIAYMAMWNASRSVTWEGK